MRSSFFGRKCIAGLIAGIVIAIPAMQATAESTYVTKGSKAASLTSCVAETADIRRNHMDYMKHDRDSTVIGGDRSIKFSIAECIDCHAAADTSGKHAPVDSEGQFCQACHAYVAVSPPCFQCHRTTPEKGREKLGSSGDAGLNYQQLNASMTLDSYSALDAHSEQPVEIQRD